MFRNSVGSFEREKRVAFQPAFLMAVVLCASALGAAANPSKKVWSDCPEVPETSPEPKTMSECEMPLNKASVKTLLACADKAGAQVTQLQEDLSGLDKVIDAASRNALKLNINDPVTPRTKKSKTEGKQEITNELLLKCAKSMRARANGAKANLEAAQLAAGTFSDASINLKQNNGAAADEPALITKAVEAHTRLIEAVSLAQAENASLRELALHLQVRQDWGGAAAVEALRFARLLRDFPEAKSLLGEDSVFLSASTKGSVASLRLSTQTDLLGGMRRYGLVISTPLDEGATKANLYSRADGLAGTTQVTFSADLYKGKPSATRLSLFSLGITGGREKRTYLVDRVAPKEVETFVHPRGVTLAGALFNFADRNKDTHVLKLGWQRTYEDGDKVTRCPVPAVGAPFVDCVQGTVGPPQRASAGVVSYQYRGIWVNYAAAPQLSYNSRSKVTDIDVPLYLVRSADEKERPFNAGISLGWASKGNSAITNRTSSDWRFGVFIGAPFSLLDVTQ